MNAWKRLVEPVAVFTIVSAGATAAGAIEGLPSWVSVGAAVLVAMLGAATRSVVTPLSDPKDNAGNQLIADK